MNDLTRRPAQALRLGLDTGGTYTDAVLLRDAREVMASAKALTTHWDLAVGLGEAIRAVLGPGDGGVDRGAIELVSVSTTLATNSVVEGRFSPTCTLLLGFDAGMAERTGLEKSAVDRPYLIAGGHDATGAELAPLDERRIAEVVAEVDSRVEAYAVAGAFAVRNPAHELAARALIRKLSQKPVTCAHELSSKLDAPRRALTAALNARLTPQIRQLILAVTAVLEAEGIDAALMIVRGDGSLMAAEMALEFPVETLLSGPAASVVGAGFLTGKTDFLVADMGGTTTDCAVVQGGRPLVTQDGALIGGWRTMVEAIDVRTVGLGGDSHVRIDRHGRLAVGPRKVTPLALFVQQHPGVLTDLRALAVQDRVPPYGAEYVLRGAHPAAPALLGAVERSLLAQLGDQPQRVSQLVHGPAYHAVLQRLVDARLAVHAAFTPSDAMHALGRQQDWCTEASVLGARLLATEERNVLAARAAAGVPEFCERVVEQVIRAAGRAVLDTALAHDPGSDRAHAPFGPPGEGLLNAVVAGQPYSRLVPARLPLALPLVAIGAPASAWYPEVARRLETTLAVPEHAAVCNAVGAVAGVVAQSADVLVSQPQLKRFRVHDPAGARDFSIEAEALASAREIARSLALELARRAGAVDAEVQIEVIERRAHMGAGVEFLAEALVRATATGRPRAGHFGKFNA